MLNQLQIAEILNSLSLKDNKQLYGYQLRLLLNPSRYKIINKPRQVGVSYIWAGKQTLKAACNGTTHLIISPSYRQSKKFMSYCYNFLELTNDNVVEVNTIEETKETIRFKGGGEIYSLPNNPSTVRGYRAHEVTIDEVAHFLNGTDQETYRAILPSMTRGGDVCLISTPFGNENLYADIWLNEDKYSHYDRITIKFGECPDVDMSIIDDVRRSDPLTFAQEYDNQLLGDVDQAEFPFKLIQSIIDNSLDYDEELRKDRVYLGGADIGRTQDMTAILVLELQPDDRKVLRKKITLHNTPYREQEDEIRGLLSTYTFKNFLIDSTGIGNNLAENLANEFSDIVRPVQFSNEIKQQMVIRLKSEMANKTIQIPNDAQLVNSIRSIRRQYTANNYLRFDAPRTLQTGHADLFWALCLAVHVDQGGTTYFELE